MKAERLCESDMKENVSCDNVFWKQKCRNGSSGEK